VEASKLVWQIPQVEMRRYKTKIIQGYGLLEGYDKSKLA